MLTPIVIKPLARSIRSSVVREVSPGFGSLQARSHFRVGRRHRITAKGRRTLGIARRQPAELGTEMKPLES
jgi:hypothetical protein